MIARAALADVPTLSGAPEEALEALARLAYEVSFDTGQRVIPMFRPTRRLVFARDGLAALTGVSSQGKQRIAFLYRPGDVIGSRFLVETPESEYEVVALTDVEGLAVRVEDLERVGEDHPEVLFDLTRAFARRVDRLCERLLTATTLDVPVRLARVLLDLSGNGDGTWRSLDHRLPHRVLAEIIGASRPHVSAVLGELEEAGAVRRGGRGARLEVCPDRLAEIVCRGGAQSGSGTASVASRS